MTFRGSWLIIVAMLGLGASACSDDTVHAASSCPVAGCGGDVTGEWVIESACILIDDCDSEAGTVSGTFTFDAGSYSYEFLIETSGCGSRGEHDASGGGSYRAEGNFLLQQTGTEQLYEYCVDGDVMQLADLSEFGGESFTLRRR